MIAQDAHPMPDVIQCSLMSTKIKVAVVGLGRLGARHADVYSKMQGVELVGVCDTHEDRAHEVADTYHTEAFTDYRKLLDRVDAASIVVPSEMHYALSRDFLNQGIHLLIEKPITTLLADADKLLTLAKKKRVVIQVGHIERFNSAVRTIKNIVKSPRFIEGHRVGPYDPRVARTGVTLDLMIHDIDIVLDIVKSPIKRVEAVGAFILSKTEDIANARLYFANGAVCDLTASRMTSEVTRKIRIFQNNAYILLDYAKQEAFIHTKQDGRLHAQKIDITRQDSLKLELTDFVDCIQHKRRPLVSGKEGRDALALALEITRQIRQKKNSIQF